MTDEDKNNVTQILEALQIKQVICVDDNYSDAPDFGEVVAVFQSIPKELIPQIPDKNIKELVKTDDAGIRKERFSEIYNGIDDNKKQMEVYSSMKSLIKDEEIEEPKLLTNLAGLISKNILKEISPECWKTKSDNIIKTAKKDNLIMLLFDMDLSNSGGTATGGIEEIRKIKDRKNIVCGLITHLGDIDDESKQWESIAEEHSLKKEEFLFISKRRLERDNIQGFIQMLKLVAINKLAAKMKKKAKQILKKANRKAYESLENIDIRDFDHMVCKSANVEGVLASDMLFRVYNTYQRLEVERIAVADTNLRQLAAEIRNTSQISQPFETTENVIKYENEERYRTAEYLNSNHLPIELGDIFFDGNTKYFILLSQPCELMMRPSGERGYKFNDALLLRISNKRDPDDPFCFPELKYWKYKSEEKYYVNFKEKYITKLCILDLCVFNINGKSIYNSESPCPKIVLPSWQLYYEKHIKKNLKKIATFYKNMANMQDDNNQLVIPANSLFRTYAINPFKFEYKKLKREKFEIKFNCQRVGRLCRERAAALLSQYSFHMSRPAFEKDLAAE